jgi:hypothetical protein
MRWVAGLTVLAVSSGANADWGFLAGFERIFDTGRDAILRHAKSLVGKSRDAWVAASRAFGQLAGKAITAVNRVGGVPGINVPGYIKTTANGFLVGAIIHHYPFGGGLMRWFEAKTEDYARRLGSFARAIGSPAGVATAVRSYARRVFGHIRGILAGTTRYAAGTMSALLADFDRVFVPVIQNLSRLARATPRRAAAAVHRFFDGFIHGLMH